MTVDVPIEIGGTRARPCSRDLEYVGADAGDAGGAPAGEGEQDGDEADDASGRARCPCGTRCWRRASRSSSRAADIFMRAGPGPRWCSRSACWSAVCDRRHDDRQRDGARVRAGDLDRDRRVRRGRGRARRARGEPRRAALAQRRSCPRGVAPAGRWRSCWAPALRLATAGAAPDRADVAAREVQGELQRRQDRRRRTGTTGAHAVAISRTSGSVLSRCSVRDSTMTPGRSGPSLMDLAPGARGVLTVEVSPLARSTSAGFTHAVVVESERRYERVHVPAGFGAGAAFQVRLRRSTFRSQRGERRTVRRDTAPCFPSVRQQTRRTASLTARAGDAAPDGA